MVGALGIGCKILDGKGIVELVIRAFFSHELVPQSLDTRRTVGIPEIDVMRVYTLVDDAGYDTFAGVGYGQPGVLTALMDEVDALFGAGHIHVGVKLTLQLQVLHAFECRHPLDVADGDIYQCDVAKYASYVETVGCEVVGGEPVGDAYKCKR